MKFEIEERDIQLIADRVSEIIKPLVPHQKQGEKDIIFDVKGLSEYLRVNHSWVYKAISLKTIPYFKAGKFPRFRKRQIDQWIETKAVKPVPSLKMVKTRGVST